MFHAIASPLDGIAGRFEQALGRLAPLEAHDRVGGPVEGGGRPADDRTDEIAVATNTDPAKNSTAAQALAGMTTLEAALERRPSFEETAAALTGGFRDAHGIALIAGRLHPEEEALADALTRDKYASDAWTRAGRMPALARP